MGINKKLRLIEFLVGFENAVLDHFKGATCALSWPEILQDKFFFPFPVVVER